MLHSPGIDALLQPRADGLSIPGFTPVVSCDILSQGVPLETGVPILGGPVQSSRQNFARRTATITLIGTELVPSGGLSDLLRLGNEIRVYRGLGPPQLASVELLPQITGGISRADVAYDNGDPVGATVQIADRGRALSRARFLYPRVMPAGSAKQMIQQLILEVAPWWSVRFVGVDDVQVSRQTFDRNRDDAVVTLGMALGAEAFSDGFGEFVVQPIPDVDGTPDFQIRGGTGGNLLTGARSISDDGVYNGVVATGQTTVNGQPPQSAPVLDTDPTSVTLWGGPFLQVPGFFDSPLIMTTQQANLAAAAQLRNVVGAARSVSFTMTPHPGLEVGDLIGVTFPDNSYEQHLIDTLSMPLTASDPIQASTRATQSSTGVS